MENVNRIKGALADAGKMGVWFAGQLGKDPVTVSKWCTNTTQPDLQTLAKISELRYADHIVYLNDGSVLLDGSPEDVLSSEILYEKNLDMPYVAVLGFQARSRGLFIDKIPTTVDEALKIFTECVQKSKGGSDGCGLS